MKPSFRPIGYTLLIVLTILIANHRSVCQDPVTPQPSKPPEKTSNGPVTGLLSEAWRKGEAADIPKMQLLVEGKPFVYPPPKVEQARDDRRVDPDVTVSVVLEKSEFQVMDPIPIKVEVHNTSDRHKIMQSADNIYRAVHVNVYDNNPYRGFIVNKSLYLTRTGGVSGKAGGSTINPHEVRHFDLFVNLAHDMTAPGNYTFFVEVYTGKNVEIDGKTTPQVARSKEFKVKIFDIPPKIGP